MRLGWYQSGYYDVGVVDRLHVLQITCLGIGETALVQSRLGRAKVTCPLMMAPSCISYHQDHRRAAWLTPGQSVVVAMAKDEMESKSGLLRG